MAKGLKPHSYCNKGKQKEINYWLIITAKNNKKNMGGHKMTTNIFGLFSEIMQLNPYIPGMIQVHLFAHMTLNSVLSVKHTALRLTEQKKRCIFHCRDSKANHEIKINITAI